MEATRIENGFQQPQRMAEARLRIGAEPPLKGREHARRKIGDMRAGRDDRISGYLAVLGRGFALERFRAAAPAATAWQAAIGRL